MLFSEITGLGETKDALVKAVENNHVAHAQLFLGSEGTANLILALAFSRYINCEEKLSNDACGKCVSCIQFNKLTHPDLQIIFPMSSIEKISKDELKAHLTKQFRLFIQEQPYGNLHDWGNFIGAENKQFNISVEEGRTILQNVSMKPYLSPFKIILIWLPELMNASMANAILKVLEEPPVKTIFLLVSNNFEKLLPTIISRCQLVKVRSFTDQEVENHLIEHQLCDLKKAKQIAKIVDGNMQRAYFLASEVIDDNFEIFTHWMRLCYSQKFAELLPFCEDLGKKGREYQKGFIQYAMQMMRDVMISKEGVGELVKQDETEFNFIVKFAERIPIERIQTIYQLLNESFLHIERNGNAKIVLFDTSIKLSQQFERKTS